MKVAIRAVLPLALVAAAASLTPNQLLAQNPPPGAILDVAAVHPTPLTSYTRFTTSFVADASVEYVSFAFREVPAFFAFDDASVTAAGSSTNLLVDPSFESDTAANVGTNFPVGWGRFIQPVDSSAIGEVASNTSTYGCNVGANTGTYFWCDGSVEGYDGLYQPLSLTVGTTYNISFYLQDDSGASLTNPAIDTLVYAGDALPIGSTPIGTPPPVPGGTTPEPESLSLVGLGIAAISALRARMKRKA